MENKIVNFGSPMQCGKSEDMKALHIMQVTSDHMEEINYKKIEELLKSIPEVHHSVIEKAVQDRNYELLGVTIVMALYQLEQENIKKALYP